MADIGETLGGLAGDFTGMVWIIIWIIIGFLLVGAGLAGYWYFFKYRKRFDIEVEITSRRSGKDRIFFDKGAILRDKANNTDYLKLWALKMELELPQFEVMENTNRGDRIRIFRESERKFRFLTPPQITKTHIIKQDGKIHKVMDSKQYPIEGDLSWILNRFRTNKRILNPEGLFMKLLEHAPQILSMVVSLILIMIVMRGMPDILKEMRNILAEMRTANEVQIIGSAILLFLKSKWPIRKGK